MERCKKEFHLLFIIIITTTIIAISFGTLLRAEGNVKDRVHEEMMEEVKAHWRYHYSINFNNYAVQDVYAPKEKIFTGIENIFISYSF